MILRRRLWWWVISGVALGVAMLPFLLSVGGVFRLPVALQERFSLAGTVQRFSWQRLELVALGWGPAGQESVQIDALSVDFSPFSLFQKKVSGLTLSGLTIHLLKGPDGFTLRGFTLPQMTHASAAGQAWHLPVGVGRLDILHGRILIHEQGALQVVPFQGHLLMDEESPQRLQFALDLWPEISGVSVSGEIDLDARIVKGDIACQLPAPATEGGLEGKFSFHLADDGIWYLTTTAVLEGGVKGSALLFDTSAGEVQSAPLRFDCRGQAGADGRGSVVCSLATERIAVADLGLEFTGVTMLIPWQFSEFSSSPDVGRVEVAVLESHGKKLGGLAMVLRQNGLRACEFKGEVHSVGISKYNLLLEGKAGFDLARQGTEISLDASLPSLNLDDVDLSEFVGLTEKIVVGGTLKAKARLLLHDGRRETSAEMAIKDGRFANADLGQEVSGITGKVSFPDLLGLRSDPAQFSLQKATFGELSLTEGVVAFRLEGEKGLFVEKASANWSEGIVRASALRFTPGNSDFEVELSCERLSLAQLFGQLGIGKFSGNGILNGRIPLSYKDGVLRVVGGLLHSPPSAGGSLHMAVHDLITAGVPADAPQFGQLEFAAAALQDFIYKSLSVAVDSKGDNLVVAMTVDGRSAKPLPFRYDAGAGTFRRVSAAGEVGINQPVQLDVNFLLPVDTLLDYGKEIKSLWDKVP